MTCYHPIKAYKSTSEKTETGKCKIFFTNSGSKTATPIQVPCGQCIGCRLDKSQQWATRCLHEASLYEENCFITLTYDNKNLPHDHSLVKHHFQKFMQDFRDTFRTRRINRSTGRLKSYYSKRLRYYQCGEYGEPTIENDYIARPHYHALIFNHNFHDREIFTEREGITLDTSDTLTGIWDRGHCTVGDVSLLSAAYIARYCLKKVNGQRKADGHYIRTDHITGENYEIEPEYSTMSRATGIGHNWFQKYKTDCYPADKIHVQGSQQSIPKYYDYLYELYSPSDIESIKQSRKQKMRRHLKDNTSERLATREQVKMAQISTLKRELK